jgi:hypothetical protein
MLFPSHSRLPAARRGWRRRGSIGFPVLVFFGIVLIVLLYAAQTLSRRSHDREELLNALDAADHAAARALVTESVFAHPYLAADPKSGRSSTVVNTDRTALINNARAAGLRFAQFNRVAGGPLLLKDNPNNLIGPDQEIVIGTLSQPLARDFHADPAVGFDPFDPDLNAVSASAHRRRVGASSGYIVDRDVVGFRLKQPPDLPPGQPPPFPPQAIPMVPIALLSQPWLRSQDNLSVWQAAAANTWENQILARRGSDQFSLDPTTGRPTAKADGIPEMQVTLTEGFSAGDNAQLVRFDTATSFDTSAVQAANGVTYADLQALGGQVLLNDGTRRDPTKYPNPNFVNLPLQVLPAGGSASLRRSFQGILGQPRVWLLYSGVNNNQNHPTVIVVGFVVARIMSVSGGTGGSGVTLVLQPSVLVTDTAVTDWTLRDLGPRSLYNPYLGRVRLVE